MRKKGLYWRIDKEARLGNGYNSRELLPEREYQHRRQKGDDARDEIHHKTRDVLLMVTVGDGKTRAGSELCAHAFLFLMFADCARISIRPNNNPTNNYTFVQFFYKFLSFLTFHLRQILYSI